MERNKIAQDSAKRITLKRLGITVAAASVFLLLLGFGYYLSGPGSNDSSYCGRCHAMQPEFLTVQNSSHAQFQCQDCHKATGIRDFIKYQGRLAEEIVFSRKGSRALKTTSLTRIPNSVCLECHSENRKYSPSSDTIVPHKKHMLKGVQCVNCHAGIAHGRIVERGVIEKIPLDQWDMSVAIDQMDSKYTMPRMAVCLDCHGKRQVTTTCSVCHSKQIIPASHRSKGWDLQHGSAARTDFKPCNLCHSYTLRQPVDLLQLNTSQYIKNNSFCSNCHLKKPLTHQNNQFRKTHGELVKTRGMESCFMCHELNDSGQKNRDGSINKIYCNKCHWLK